MLYCIISGVMTRKRCMPSECLIIFFKDLYLSLVKFSAVGFCTMQSFIKNFTSLMVNHPWFQPGHVGFHEKVLRCVFPHVCCTSVCCTYPGRILSGGLIQFSCKSVRNTLLVFLSVSAHSAVHSAGKAFPFLMAIHILLDYHDSTVSFTMTLVSKFPHTTLPTCRFLYTLFLATQILEL